MQVNVDVHTVWRMFQYLRDGFFVDLATQQITFAAVTRNAATRSTALWRLTLKRLPSGVCCSATEWRDMK
jgi:hypothetical protein